MHFIMHLFIIYTLQQAFNLHYARCTKLYDTITFVKWKEITKTNA